MRRPRDNRDRKARGGAEPTRPSAEAEVVYICAEGRPWEKDSAGGYRRIDVDAVQSERVITADGIARRRIVGRSVKPKPYDDKNGF